MLAKLLTPRIAGAVGGTLLVATLASGAFAYIQTQRLEAANDRAASRDLTIAVLKQRVANDATAVKQRDAVIRLQSNGLEAILKSRWQDRQVYLAGIAAADTRAAVHTTRADELIRLKAPDGDEAAQCRAARELLEKELTQ